MEISFDRHILSVINYIEDLRQKGRKIREIYVAYGADSLSDFLNNYISNQNSTNIVLRSDTFLELGNPASGSCAMTLCSDNPELLEDGRIILIGEEIGESASPQLPFGQVVMIGGEYIDIKDYHQLLQWQNTVKY